MISNKYEPNELSRAELDAYLELGWFRIGRALITTEYLESDGQVRSAVWTRLPLLDYRFKRSLRKLMASNARLFSTKVGPAVIDPEHEALYARYRATVQGRRSATLAGFLGEAQGRQLFDTQEISLFAGDALVAFSWFDLGEQSVQSLLGVYDPDFAGHSLGFYTLLLEITHALELGLKYHYTGYVLAEPSCMDYKRRVGELEYLDPATQRWSLSFPYAPSQSPAEVLRGRLHEAKIALERAGANVCLIVNAALQIPGLLERYPKLSSNPLLLTVASETSVPGVLVGWVHSRQAYELFGGEVIIARFDDASDETLCFFLCRKLLCEVPSVAEMTSLFMTHYWTSSST